MKNRLNLILVAIPYLWLGSFLMIPLLLILKVSLAQEQISQPPYTGLFVLEQGSLKLLASLEHYQRILSDRLYFLGLFDSTLMALGATILCLVIGYPMAYALAHSPLQYRWLLLTAVVLPLCISFLLRTYAMIGLLNNTGYINQLLMALSIIDKPIAMMNSSFSVYLGMVYNFLPFMIIALYSDLSRHESRQVEAALDLGARPWQVFLQITLPKSLPGIGTGCLLVFIPALGDYVIPSLLGGSGKLMVGRMIFDELFSNLSWPAGAALAVVFMGLALFPLMLFQRSLSKMQQRSA